MIDLRDLLAEGDSNGYSDSEGGDELRASVEEAHKLAEIAVQITSGNKKGVVLSMATRGGSSTEKRMGLDELVDFMEQVSAVPCRIPEAELLQVGVVRVWHSHCAMKWLNLQVSKLIDRAGILEAGELLIFQICYSKKKIDSLPNYENLLYMNKYV